MYSYIIAYLDIIIYLDKIKYSNITRRISKSIELSKKKTEVEYNVKNIKVENIVIFDIKIERVLSNFSFSLTKSGLSIV